MKQKIQELRAILPIPLLEAKQLLENNGNDVETCVYLYKAKAIKEIMTATDCDSKLAEEYYEREKYDINRAISFIRALIYDQNYQAIDGVNHNSLAYVKDWIHVMKSNDFAVSLNYPQLNKAIETMLLIKSLSNIAQLLDTVKKSHDLIFAGYSNASSIEDYIKRNRVLDNNEYFQIANEQIPLQVSFIENEVSKHWRNT